ncbi:MAG TPA: DUF1361 domain-containing protein [Chitinophagaceae bacterium]|nr:DUF1361 domain-containing protein [Chitinophagaceae bacterium]
MLQKISIKKNRELILTMQHWLIVSCGFSFLLLSARIFVTGHMTYLFLVWNLFLAFVPYAITQWASVDTNILKNRVKLIAMLSTWLLFIPNSFYILTDLFHLDAFDSAPKWFDLLLIFSFAWNGIVLGIVSIRKIETIMENVTGRNSSLLIVFIVMWLNAFGIYIGRYLRFNSWDIVMQPFSLFREMFEVLFHPLKNKMEWGMIGVYAVFMTVLYITIKKLGENFSQTQSSK